MDVKHKKITAEKSRAELLAEKDAILAELSGMNSQPEAYQYAFAN